MINNELTGILTIYNEYMYLTATTNTLILLPILASIRSILVTSSPILYTVPLHSIVSCLILLHLLICGII